MLDWLDRLRQKPKAVRDQYAFFGALIVTGCITVVWAVSLPSRLASIEDENGTDEEITGAFSNFFNDAKQNVAHVLSATEQDNVGDESAENDEDNADAAVIVPSLSEETIEKIQEKEAAQDAPAERTVRIGTTSSTSTTNVREDS